MTTTATSRKAILNFSIVGLNKLAQTLGSIAFVLIIPKLLGVDLFGQFAFVTSLFIIATRIGDLGMEEVLVRFIPEALGEANEQEIQHIVGRLLAVRLLVGAVIGASAALWAFQATTWLTTFQATLVSLIIWLYVIALLPFEVLLGLGQVGKWAINSSWRQFALILTIGFFFGVLRLDFDGVILALFVTQLCFISLGLWWSRAYLRWHEIRFDWPLLKPYISAGVIFFIANLCIAAMHRSGALAIEVLTHDSAQVGFFELGNSLYLMLFLSITQAMIALLPLASQLHTAGEDAEMGRWFGLLQRMGVVFAVIICGGVWGMAPVLVEPIFGVSFSPVVDTMSLVMIALAIMMLGYPAGLLSIIWREPQIRLWASVGAFIIATITLSTIVFWQAQGAVFAIIVGVTSYALIIWIQVRERIVLAWGKGLLGLVLGGVFLPLWWIDHTILATFLWPTSQNTELGMISVAVVAAIVTTLATLVYIVLTLIFSVISIQEVQSMIHLLKRPQSSSL